MTTTTTLELECIGCGGGPARIGRHGDPYCTACSPLIGCQVCGLAGPLTRGLCDECRDDDHRAGSYQHGDEAGSWPYGYTVLS